MRVFIVGGTGLIGSEAASLLLQQGHTVSAIALPPLPPGFSVPDGLELTLGNYMTLPDDVLRAQLEGCDALVFAAGVDERVEGPPPIYELFRHYNITPLERLFRLAKTSGVRQVIVCGSYFTYFDRIWPEKQLTRWHPYIHSRKEQQAMALSFAGEQFHVAVLELPYIFGAQPGRKPVWLFLVEMIRRMKPFTFFPRGGTAMVTVRQAAQAICGALLINHGGRAYPIGYANMTWQELLTIIHRHMGCPDKRIITIPDWLFALSGRQLARKQRKAGLEGGLNMSRFADLQCASQFIDQSLGCEPLGVQPDDIDAAIGSSVRLCLDILDRQAETIGMKGE